MARGETLKFTTAGLAKGARRGVLGCHNSGADGLVDVQSDLIPKYGRVKNDSSSNPETFPDHPPKGNVSWTIGFVIPHGSTTDI